jgi:hypothetical protein
LDGPQHLYDLSGMQPNEADTPPPGPDNVFIFDLKQGNFSQSLGMPLNANHTIFY